MPTLVRITNEKNTAAILRHGIRLPRKGKAVYFMPILHSHFISHQWIRELRRFSGKVLVGVYFRLPSSERVWAGRYNKEHRSITLGEAIREISSLNDPLGYELFINRPITTGEIQKIRPVPQGVGWRYMPHAHGRQLCGCPVCLRRGEFKSRSLRERLDPRDPIASYEEIKAKLPFAEDDYEITDLLYSLRQKRRRVAPDFLRALLISPSASAREDVALTLGFFRHPDSRQMLQQLIHDEDLNVSTAAKESLKQLGGLDLLD